MEICIIVSFLTVLGSFGACYMLLDRSSRLEKVLSDVTANHLSFVKSFEEWRAQALEPWMKKTSDSFCELCENVADMCCDVEQCKDDIAEIDGTLCNYEEEIKRQDDFARKMDKAAAVLFNQMRNRFEKLEAKPVRKR